MNRAPLSLINQLTFIAIISALQIIFLLLNQWTPFVGYWLTYFLPFFPLLVLIKTQWKGYLIYSFTSLVLILLLMSTPFEVMLFYWFPALILGTGYALAIKNRFSLFELVLGLSIMQFFTLYVLRIISLAIYEIDLLNFLYQLLDVMTLPNIELMNPIMIYIIALLQVFISVVLLLPFIERWRLPIMYQVFFGKRLVVIYGVMLSLALLLTLFAPQLAFYLLGPLTLLSLYAYTYFFLRPLKFATYGLLTGLFLYPFINAMLSDILTGPFRILSILFLGVVAFGFVVVKSITQTKQNDLR
jgi:hypothetical protein